MAALMPTYEPHQVGTVAAATPQASPANPAVFGAGLAKGVSELGGLLADIEASEQRKQNLQKAQDFQTFMGRLDSQFELDVKATQGEDAYGGKAKPDKLRPMLEAYDKQVSDWIQKNITNGNQADYALNKAQEHRNAAEHLMLSHAARERAAGEVEALTLAQGAAINKIAVTATDPNRQHEYKQAYDDGIANLDAYATAHGWSKEKLDYQVSLFKQDVASTKAKQLLQVNPASARTFIKENRDTLGTEQQEKLLDAVSRHERELADQAHDSIFQTTMLPALEKKQYISGLTAGQDYQTMKQYNPAGAAALVKNVEAYNSGLAADRFNDWMTGLGSGQRNGLTFGQVPERIRSELREYNPEYYNTLAKRFDEERQLRADRAAARGSQRGDTSMLTLEAMLNPDSINQGEVVRMIQSGQMPPKLGLSILNAAQKGGDIGGRLHQRQFAEMIDNEADQLTQGIRVDKERSAAKKRIVGAINDTLESSFSSTFQVTPDAVKSALQRMRTATVTQKGGWISSDKEVPALAVDPGATVLADKNYTQALRMYQRRTGKTWAQAVQHFTLLRSLGVNPLREAAHGVNGR
jgi:hypothetical protein